MFIRLLLTLMITVLAFVGYYLNKNQQNLSKVLANKGPEEPIQVCFKKFAHGMFGLALVGFVFLVIGTKVAALVYLTMVMATSAYFTINLAKLIS